MDIEKISGAATSLLSNYVYTFIAVLSHPRESVRALVVSSEVKGDGLQRAAAYSLLSLAVGLCIGVVVQLPGTPDPTSLVWVVGSFALWVLAGLVVHMYLRLIGARGRPTATIAVVLYVVGTVQIIWIPMTAFLGSALYRTEVTLSYQYVIAANVRAGEITSETFIKEEEPERDATVAAPMDPAGQETWQGDPRRVQPGGVALPPPERKEVRRPRPVTALVLGGYAAAILVYLALGLSEAHLIPTRSVIAVAFPAPILAGAVGFGFMSPNVGATLCLLAAGFGGSLLALARRASARQGTRAGLVANLLVWWLLGTFYIYLSANILLIVAMFEQMTQPPNLGRGFLMFEFIMSILVALVFSVPTLLIVTVWARFARKLGRLETTWWGVVATSALLGLIGGSGLVVIAVIADEYLIPGDILQIAISAAVALWVGIVLPRALVPELAPGAFAASAPAPV